MKKLFIILSVLLCLVGCQKQKYQRGSFEGVTYTNSFFGFSMVYSSGYEVYQEEQLAQMLNTTIEELENSGLVYEYMVADVDQMPIFQFYVEHYKFTTMLTYEDFVAQVVQQFISQKGTDYTLDGVNDVEINGVLMKKIPLLYSVGAYTVHEDIYLVNKDNYVGTLIITYLDDQKEVVEEIIQSVHMLE